MNMPDKRLLTYQHPLVLWFWTVLLLGIFFATASYLVYQKEYSKAQTSAREAADTYNLLTQGVLEDLDRLVDRAARQYLLYPDKQNRWLTEQVLRERKLTNPHIMDLLVTDAEGRTQVWTGNGVPPDISARSYIRHHLDNPRTDLFVSEPLPSLVHEGQWFLALSRAVRSSDGSLKGLGVAIIAIAPLQQTYGRLLTDPSLAVSLLHESGHLVLRVPAHGVATGSYVAGNLGIELPVAAPRVLDVAKTFDGKRRLLNIQPVPGTSLLVSGASNLDGALALARLMFLSLLLLWLVIAAASFALARKLGLAFDRERRSQALYESLFTGVSDAIFVLGVEDGGRSFRYLAVNPVCEELAGVPASDMNGRTPWERLPADAAERMVAKCRGCVETGEDATYEEYLDIRGVRRTWMTTLSPVSSAIGEVTMIVGAARDITEQSRLAVHLSSINENLPGFVYQLQRDAGGNFRYLYASDGVARMIGVTPQQVLENADVLLGAIHPDDVQRVFRESLDTAARGVVWHSRFRMESRDGRMLWVEAHDTPRNQVDGRIVWTGYCYDVTEQVRLEQALRDSEASFRTFVENANDIIFTLSGDGMINYVSPNWVEALGHPVEKVLGHPLAEFLHPEDASLCESFLHTVMTTGTKQQGIEYRVRHQDGNWRWHILNASPLFDGDGQVIKCLGIARDITTRREAEDRIAYLAHYDQLTGLPNRILFSELAERALHMARRQHGKLALMYIDLDKFKPVNDLHGHAVGDLLLREVAKRMSGCLREVDTLARIGGDEFVVLLHSITGSEDALVPAGKIVDQLRRPFVINGLELHISCSIGVVIYPQYGDDMIELTRHADEAMYAAKKAGRDQVVIYDPSMGT